MVINLEEYRSKTLGCWMGKNIGGTLGVLASYVGHRLGILHSPMFRRRQSRE